jgi:PAS domain S-box-containing protein
MNERPRILVVDDDEGTRTFLTVTLGQKAYETEMAATGEEALGKARERAFDLALLDLMLPDMRGVDLIARLRELHPYTGVIVITGYASVDSAVQALNAGASGYVTKPLNMDELLAVAREALEKQRLAEDRRRAEEALRQEKDRAQKYLDIAGVAFVALNAKGEVTLVNRKATEILGHEQEGILGRNWFDCFVPMRVEAQVRAVFDKLMAGEIEPAEYYENPVVTTGGGERIIAWRNSLLEDGEGNIIGTLSSGEDITERKQVEEALQEYSEQLEDIVEKRTQELRESEERFQALLSSLDDVVWAASGDGSEFLYINDAAERVYGRPASEFFENPDTWIEVVYPDDRERVWRESQDLLKQGTSESEYRILRRDGEVRWLHDRKSVIFDDAGNPVRIGGIASDITARKRAQAELRRHRDHLEEVVEERTAELAASEARYRSLFDNARDALFLSDTEGQYLDVNPAACQMLRYSRDELMAMDVLQVGIRGRGTSAEERAQLLAELQHIWRQGLSGYETELIPKSGGPIPVEMNIAPLTYRGREAVLSAARDISERRRAEAELARHVEELERFNRLAVGRELRMIELKRRVNELSVELGQEPPYDLSVLEG